MVQQCPTLSARAIPEFPKIGRAGNTADLVRLSLDAAEAYRSCVLALEELEARANARK